MKKCVNPARLAQGAMLMLTGLALLWLAATRGYQYYVTPRTLPYLYFAAVMFLATGTFNFIHLREVSHIRRYAHLTALLLPFLLLAASTNLLGLWEAPQLHQADANGLNDPAYLDEPYTMQTLAYAGTEIHGYDGENRTITIMEAETYQWLVEIYRDPTPFLGYTIRTMGQMVTESEYLSQDCFSPIRKLMTCCVADMFSIGFTCQYDQPVTFADGDWVIVTGTLEMADMEEYQELRIAVQTLESCAPPDEPYVYSY